MERRIMGAWNGSQACIDQTQPPTKGKPEADGAAVRNKPKDALRDGLASPEPCIHRINHALGKAPGAKKAASGRADSEHRRGKHHPGYAIAQRPLRISESLI
jgi:hypothetical protein